MLKYRTSIITGYFSFNHQYDFLSTRYDNEPCRIMAIDYFQKVEKQCSPYVQNKQYYLYTLQCYERLAILYRNNNNRSFDYYEKMIRLCLKYHPDDLGNLTIGYEGLLKTYQQQRMEPSESLSVLLCSDHEETSVTSNETSTSDVLFQNFKPLHFAFEFYEKQLDPRLKAEPNLHKKIIYCHLKLAALYYDQNKIDEAKHSLSQAISFCQPTDMKITQICDENLFFIQRKFDLIIQSYLARSFNPVDHCIDEDNYCYIAHLYTKANKLQSAERILQKPLENFEQYNYICSHTIYCYTKLADFYQLNYKDIGSTIRTYERAIQLFKKHHQNPVTLIVEEYLVPHFKQTNDFDIIIDIFKILYQILPNDTTDISILYNQTKRIWRLLINKFDAYKSILNSYDAFLDLTLKSIGSITPQMTMVLDHYRPHFVDICINANLLHLGIKIYQQLFSLLFKYSTDMMKIIDLYHLIAGEFVKKKLFDESIDVYEHLLVFLNQHPTTGQFIEVDKIEFIFYFWKHRIISEYLLEKKYDAAIDLYYRMIYCLENYRLNFHMTYYEYDFASKLMPIYDEISSIQYLKNDEFHQIMLVYQEKVNFLIKNQVGNVQTQINTIFTQCEHYATVHPEKKKEIYTELSDFIQKNRLDYLPYLSSLDDALTQLKSSNSSRLMYLHQQICNYRHKAKTYLDENRPHKAEQVYREELSPFLLENHAR
ncbi:unnamed protein product, partial [Adineta ricciae]